MSTFQQPDGSVTTSATSPAPAGVVNADPDFVGQLLNDLYSRRNELTAEQWQEAAPLLLGIASGLYSRLRAVEGKR